MKDQADEAVKKGWKDPQDMLLRERKKKKKAKS